MSAGGYTAQLQRKRATMNRRLMHSGQTCTIYRQTRELNDYGKPVDSEKVVASDVPCLLVRASHTFGSQERVTGGEVQSLSSYTLMVPWHVQVLATDQFEIDGRRLEIIGGTGDITTQVVRQFPVAEINPQLGPAEAMARMGVEAGVRAAAVAS